MGADEFVPCDRCGMRSFVFAELANGGEVSYCGHHGGMYWDALIYSGATIVDLRHMIGYV